MIQIFAREGEFVPDLKISCSDFVSDIFHFVKPLKPATIRGKKCQIQLANPSSFSWHMIGTWLVNPIRFGQQTLN